MANEQAKLALTEFDALNPETFDELVDGFKEVARAARRHIGEEANRAQLLTYWVSGRMIVMYEQDGRDRAEYGEQTLKRLSARLRAELGRGYSVTNLQNMRRFYLTYKKQQTLSVKLTWSQYIDLMGIDDEDKRSFYAHEAANCGWDVRELRRQIDSMLFERVLKAKSNAKREHVLKLASEGVVPRNPADIIREPYVLEFIDFPDDEPPMESELEAALVAHIEKFMRELGRGFWFIGTQQRITIGNVHYHVDMVFYNKLLRSYVLIELKTTPLLPAAVGQLNAYLNYYSEEVNDEFDNPPIGIILCTDKRNVDAHYALGGLENQVFASTYTTVMPDEEELAEQVLMAIEANERRSLAANSCDAPGHTSS